MLPQPKKQLILKKNIVATPQHAVTTEQAIVSTTESIQDNPLPPGLIFVENFITAEEEQTLIDNINKMPWDHTLMRLTQHYGYKYPYRSRDKLEPTDPIPDFCTAIRTKLEKEYNRTFDQLIINRYEPGQGISAHTDHVKLFGDTIISLSLGSPCNMDFSHGGKTICVPLPRRSLVVLQADSRYKWKHSIVGRKSDNGIARSIRISMTFRQKI